MRLSLTVVGGATAAAPGEETSPSPVMGIGSMDEPGVVVEATRRSPSCSESANWPSNCPGTEPEAS